MLRKFLLRLLSTEPEKPRPLTTSEVEERLEELRKLTKAEKAKIATDDELSEIDRERLQRRRIKRHVQDILKVIDP